MTPVLTSLTPAAVIEPVTSKVEHGISAVIVIVIHGIIVIFIV